LTAENPALQVIDDGAMTQRLYRGSRALPQSEVLFGGLSFGLTAVAR
jgi:hypothetical protein